MPLRKATQSVISPNICTIDTDQIITGNKIFSNPISGNVNGVVTGNVIGSASLNVLKTGDTMTGHLNVPAGAVGSETPRASEVVSKSGDTINGNLIVSTNTSTDALRVTQIGTGAALRIEDSANPDSTPLIVTASGDVGIGTSTPTNKLHVNGRIYCTDLSISGDIYTPQNLISFTARIKGNIADITSITSIAYIPSGSGSDVTITKSSHGLLVDDSITFVGQTGNNAALNGTWKINSADANTFTFTITTYPAALSAAGITASFPIRPVRIVSVFDAGYGSLTPNSISKDADGSYKINFYNTKYDANYIAIGNCCNSGISSGTFSPFGYSTGFFQFKTYTLGTSTLANFSDINVVIY